MILKSKRCLLLCVCLVFVLFSTTDCKRGGGRRGGTYRGSSNVWGRAKQNHGAQGSSYDQYGTGQRRAKGQAGAPTDLKKPDVPPDAAKASAAKPSAPKPSAPAGPTNVQKSSAGDSSAGFIQQEKKQQLAPLNTANTNTQQRPIGWDVGKGAKPEGPINKNVGWNVGNSNPQAGGSYASSANLGNQPVYPSHAGAYPNTGASSYYGTGTNYNYGNGNHQPYGAAPPAYSAQAPNYHNNMGAPPAYSAQAPNYHNSMGAPPAYSAQAPNYYNNMGAPPAYSPMGYNNYGGGGGGGMFGGNNYGRQGGYGGYGGGGYGGYGGVGGYGKSFGGGFGSGFGKHAVRNVVIGLLVWNLVSGLTRRPYYVYNHDNNPERIPQDIPLPANLIILCPESENVAELCAGNTAPLCTTNGTIMCVALAQKTVPCDGNSAMKCVNSTVTCANGGPPPCDGKEAQNATSAVNIPCVTNATIIGKMLDNTTMLFSGSGTLNEDSTNLCVTTLAVPQPEEDANKGVAPLCDQNVQAENTNGTSPCIGNSTNLSETGVHPLNATVPNLQNVTYPLAM